MAFDIKGASADTTFSWSSAFLMGADSQSATDPSIYAASVVLTNLLSAARTWAATQTITPAANTNALAVSSYSLTGSNAQSLIDLAGTWNTSGTPTAIKLNLTDTASNAASLFLDLQIGSASKLSIDKTGRIVAPYVGGMIAFRTASGANGFGLMTEGPGMTIQRGDASHVARFYGNSGSHLCGQVFVGCQVGGTSQDDASLTRVAAAIVGVRGATTSAGAALNFLEQTAPSTPSADQVVLYADNGGAGGKSRLMALFQSGAAQPVALEP